uniref:UPF0481 protein At3g47200-like n=1 Tax=Erigeron canadensis TaxID=72917 RepID=UPI001CB939E7|nr:UPF0481 protein At3g47200-like [Erigeron canadensis]
MSAQVEVSNGGEEDGSWVIDSIANFTLMPSSSSTGKIHRVPTMVKGSKDHYQKYYVPKVVSIGPYHHGNPNLDLVERLKPGFTMKLLPDNKENLRSLWKKFGEPNKVQELRNFYEEKSTIAFCDKVFVKMMLLDACFILYYIQHIFGKNFEDVDQDLKSHQIVYVRQDLLLLENQIPFDVLDEVMKLMQISREKIKPFIIDNILACGEPSKRWYGSIYSYTVKNCNRFSEKSELDFNKAQPDHLLHLLHLNLTKEKAPKDTSRHIDRCTFRNVTELTDVGIQFKPNSSMSLADIKFFRTWWWWFSASVKLPPITVDDSTKPKLLNLIAYEMCSQNAGNSWVTSYICLLDALIDHPEDVKTLRKSGVLDNSLGSDKEVAKLFNEIGTDLVPNNLAYLDAKNKIQRHYESWRNGCFSQLKHEYVKSPWAFIALIGALLALFLSGVQTYYTVWSPKGDCDYLCLFLRRNHHL